MSQLVNFSSLQSSASITSGDQILIRKDNSLSGAQGFVRIPFINFEKSTTVYSTVNNLSTHVKDLSSYWSGGSNALIKTYSQLKLAIANSSIETIILGDDIYFTGVDATLTIPRRCSINFNGYKFIKTGSTILFIQGEVLASRVQIFSGWDSGDIKGTFKNESLFPEWWGLQGDSVENGRHDIAINCAINTADPSYSIGRKISFAQGTYYVGRPLDATNLAIRFEGAGSGATIIESSKLWTSDEWKSTTRFRFWNDFIKYSGTTNFTSAGPVANGIKFITPRGGSYEFLSGGKARITNSPAYSGEWTVVGADSPTSFILSGTSFVGSGSGIATPITLDSEMEVGANTSSLIWIGGNNARYWTGVQGLTLIGKWAIAQNPLKRINGISWKASVEELTIIKDVDVQNFSGIGIGGGMYDDFNNIDAGKPFNVQDGGVVNGLTIENFWIKESSRRGSIPIFLNKNTYVCTIKSGTIDCSTTRAATVSSVSYPYARTWPLFGMLIYAGDGTHVQNVHLEGMGIGVHIGSTNDIGGMITLDTIESERLMSFGMRDVDQFQSSDSFYVPITPPNSLAHQMANESFGYFDYYKNEVPALSGFLPNTGSYLFRYSTLVTVGTTFEKSSWDSGYPNNMFTCLNIHNLSTPSQYVLRDLQYGIDITSLGSGANPNSFSKNIAAYSRGIAYGLPTGTYPSMVDGTVFNDYPVRNTGITWTQGAKPLSAWDKTYYSIIY